VQPHCSLVLFYSFNYLHFILPYFVCLFIFSFPCFGSKVCNVICLRVHFLCKRLQWHAVADSRPRCSPIPLRNPHPTGSAKGCRGAAGDSLVIALAGHNRDK
jgi:hypothetical protein